MSALVLLVLSACELPSVEGLSPQQIEVACALQAKSKVEAEPDRAALESIFARPGFERARASASGDWLKRVKAWLSKVFETSGAEVFSNITRVVVLMVAALLAIAAVVRLAGRRRSATPAGGTAASGPSLTLEDPHVHLGHARALLATDPRAAAREGLLAMLSALERARLATPDRVKTNRELVNELPKRGADEAITRAVSEQVSWFDGAWYSATPFEAERTRAFLEASARVVALASAFQARA